MSIIRDDFNIESPCGGKATCGKCKIKLKGKLSPICEAELRHLTESEINDGIRLACMTYAEGEFDAYFDETGDMLIQTEGTIGNFDFSPIAQPYGIAVDIGTTTIAIYLCDLASGIITKTASVRNPQCTYGADVITRLGYIIEYENGLEKLRYDVIKAINKAIASFEIEKFEINAAVIAGNTVMEHIAFGFDPKGIANSPFTTSTLFGRSFKAEEVGLAISPTADVYAVPCFSAYVGGDIASGLVASDVDISKGYEIFIDVGTNGEIAAGNSEKLSLCSTAAGPAFEGAKIEKGMPGIAGAIKSFSGDSFEVIGDIKPIGICGSALIDAAAVMLDREVLDETGRLETEPFYLDHENNIYITGKDIRELQLAKSAICAGIVTLLENDGKTFSDVTRVVLAGGFGANLNRRNACRIGLIPPQLEDKIYAAGNTSGMGAIAYLMSDKARRRISDIRNNAVLVELSTNEYFMNQYIEQMFFTQN